MLHTQSTYSHILHFERSMDSKEHRPKYEMQACNRTNTFQSKIQKLRNTDTIKENIEKVLEFDRECEHNGHKIASRYSIVVVLHYLCQFARKKPFKEFTKTDIMTFLEACQYRKFKDTRHSTKANPENGEKQISEGSINLIKLRIKQFFQWLYDMPKGQYPDCVRWINLRTIKGTNELRSEDLPTSDEVTRMIECTESPRDRALISLLAESGARVGEVSMIRLKDISWNANGFVLTLRGKTGQRQIPLCGCAIDLKDWINNFHPFKGDSQAPLFVNPGRRDGPVTNLGIYGISAIVRRVARRSDVEKRIHVYPHLFRHLRATQLAEAGWNEMMLREYFGWSKISNMPAVYIHLSRRSLSDKYYQMYGKVKPESKKIQMFEEPKVCSVCGMQNPHGYCFCLRCNATLDRNKLNRLEKANEVKKTLNFIAQDTELSQKLLLLIQEANKKQKHSHPTYR